MRIRTQRRRYVDRIVGCSGRFGRSGRSQTSSQGQAFNFSLPPLRADPRATPLSDQLQPERWSRPALAVHLWLHSVAAAARTSPSCTTVPKTLTAENPGRATRYFRRVHQW